jgi:hypothetical protein
MEAKNFVLPKPFIGELLVGQRLERQATDW